MADFDQFSAEPTHESYDNDFERLDPDSVEGKIAGENPEEDLYSADSSQIPTGELLSFEDSPPTETPRSGFDAGFSNPIPEAVPDSTSYEPESTPDAPSDPWAASEAVERQPTPPPAPAPIQTEPEPEPTPAAPVKEYEPTPTPPSSPALGALIDTSKIDPRVVELIYWRDPKKTGPVFASVLLVLLALSMCSFISVVAYLLLAVMTVTISFRVYKTVMQAVQKTGEGHPFKPYLDQDITLSKVQVEKYTDKVIDHINAHSGSLRHLLLVEDLVDSIKFAVVLWLLTYVGAWFNGLTLVMLAWIDLFTLPIVYEKYQVQIDDAVGKAHAQINTVIANIKTKIPWLKKKEE
ncbi:reticulon-1-A-like isoform X2 [Acanthaster planci]|uniref:Reticulon-like protein n=1 Tax=Acanthaster planci TaxID=133434 RepID=A0A8B7ZD98_ACAPL|nr:reticulon-1-A-like isoform X2 [Acanthaster planci]